MARPEVESSVQMKLYTLTKRQFSVVFIAFALAFTFFLFVGILGPAVMHTHVLNATCKNPVTPLTKCGIYSMTTPSMTTYSQQLWLVATLRVDTSPKDAVDFVKPINISVDIQDIKNQLSVKKLESEEFRYHRRRKISCKSDGKCEDLVVLHLGFLASPAYFFRLKLDGLQTVKLSKIAFSVKTYNASFTELEIWIRVIFLFFSFLVSCWFVQVMKKFAFRDWSLEQRFMALLLPLLLLYNNPLFPLNFLTTSWIPGVLDGLFQATFLCSLLMFWICLYHGIRVQERHLSFYLPKIIIIGVLWLTALILSTCQVRYGLQNPTYLAVIDTGSFIGFKTIFFFVGTVYVLYLLYLLIRSFAELKSLPFFNLRLRFLTLLMVFVLAISIAIFILRFGSTVFQDNFVANLSFTYKNSVEFLTFYSLLNLYVYLMAYVYSPSKNAVYETHFRDNPTMSMLNETDDEDDDVIYEETLNSKIHGNVSGRRDLKGGPGRSRSGPAATSHRKTEKRLIQYGESEEEEDLFNTNYKSMPF